MTTPLQEKAADNLFNKISAPLYDPNDPLVKAALKKGPFDLTTKPIERDTSAQSQINEQVVAFKKANPGKEVVVIYSGATVHGVGAALDQQQKGFTVIETALQPLDTKLIDKSAGLADKRAGLAPDKRVDDIRSQMQEEQRVLNGYGYKDYDSFHQKQAQIAKKMPDGRDLFIVLGETGHHGATYVRESETNRGNMIYSSIADYVEERQKSGKSVAVLFLGEGLNPQLYRKDFDNNGLRPEQIDKEILFARLKKNGATFGIGDATDGMGGDGTFGVPYKPKESSPTDYPRNQDTFQLPQSSTAPKIRF